MRWEMLRPAMPWLIENRETLPEQVFINSGVVNALADRDIDAALELVAGMADEDIYPKVTGQLFSSWSATHPVDASAYIDANMEPGLERDYAVEALVSHLKMYDSEAAKRWAETIQDDSLRKSAARLR